MTGPESARDPVRRQTEALLARVLGLDPEQVHPAARVREDLGLDSCDLVELLEEMEARFAVSISERLLDEAATVADLVAAVRRGVARARRPRRRRGFGQRGDAPA